MSPVMFLNPDGEWEQGESLSYLPTFDVEEYDGGKWRLYYGHEFVGKGFNRLKITRGWAIQKAIRRYQKERGMR